MSDQQKCLEALERLTHPSGEPGTFFWLIAAETDLDQTDVRKHIRALAKDGMAQYFPGAGHAITEAGVSALSRGNRDDEQKGKIDDR